MNKKQFALRKLTTNAKFWIIETSMRTVTEGIKITPTCALINGKYEMMNPDCLVYVANPTKQTKGVYNE